MRLQKLFQRIGNVFIGGILRSPFHAMLSKNTLLLTFTGKVSGKRYSTPVNYALIGEELYIASMRNRTWWRNLRGGAPVVLRLQGHTVNGWGEVFEDEVGVERGMTAYLQAVPKFAKYFDIRLDKDDRPNQEEVAQAARRWVMIRIKRDER